jgi:hypothetical protein
MHAIGGVDSLSSQFIEPFHLPSFDKNSVNIISRKAAKAPRKSKPCFSWFSLRLGVLSEQRERA